MCLIFEALTMSNFESSECGAFIPNQYSYQDLNYRVWSGGLMLILDPVTMTWLDIESRITRTSDGK